MNRADKRKPPSPKSSSRRRAQCGVVNQRRELRASDERYRYLFQNNPQPMLVYDLETLAFLDVNEAMIHHYGYAREEFLAMTIKEIRPPEEIPQLLEQVSRTTATIDVSSHGTHRKKDGTLIDVEIVSHAFTFGERRARLVLVNDVTARRRAEREILRQHEQLAALNQIGQSLTKLAAPSQILELIYATIGHVLDNRNFYIALYDEKKQEISFPVYTMDGERKPVGSRPLGKGLSEYVLRTRLPLLIPCDVKETLEKLGIAHLGRQSFSLLSVPITADEEAIGVITIQDYYRPNVYTTADLKLLSTCAAQAAIAIQNARLYAAEQQRARELETLVTIGQRLTGTLDLPTVLASLLDETAQIVPGHALAIMLYDSAQEELKIESARGYPGEVWRNFRVRLGEGVTGRAALTRQPILIRDTTIAPEWLGVDGMPVSGSEMAVPLVFRDRLVGVINVESQQPAVFDEHHLRLFAAIADHAAIAIENARLFEETRQRTQQLALLYDAGLTLNRVLDSRVQLEFLIKIAAKALHAERGDFFRYDSAADVLRFELGLGYPEQVEKAIRACEFPLGEERGLVGWVGKNHLPLNLPDVAADPRWISFESDESRIHSALWVPIEHEGELLGVLNVSTSRANAFTPHDERLLVLFANQVAVAMLNARLYEQAEQNRLEMTAAYEATIEGWSRALDLRDKETEGHTQRVTTMAVRLAWKMGIRGVELVHIRYGALLHDIGKMGVPDAILLKPGPLTREEWQIMHQHPACARDLLLPIMYLRPALDIPFCHHEQWDGVGYPRGLSGEEIPLFARIFAVVDVWDALRSDRPYRPAWSEAKAREHIRSLAGTHFDPKVVQAFLGLEETKTSD